MAESESESKGKQVGRIPIGIRNNNPLNIVRNGIKWKGQIKHPSKFCVFMEPKYGWRAALIIICRSYRKRGLTTVWKIINSWAPPSENKTWAYAKFVAEGCGVGLNSPLPSIYYMPTLYFDMLRSMAIIESGYEYIDDELVKSLNESIDAFLKEFPKSNK